VRLIEWRMPTFKFKFTYTQSIPIYPPLYAQFGGTIGADINIGFGYDTYGIQKYISSEDKNWVDILDGFYVLDFDANGNEQPELRLYGELFAGAEINLVIVKAGVRGGLGFELTFDLNDVNDDGKIRVSEIVANAQQDPRCIFDIEGRIYLFLEAFLKIDLFFFSIDKTWRFAEITLFSFEITCPEPVLASNSSGGTFTSGDLYLNIGSRAGDREEIDTNDNSETMIVKHVGGTAGDESVEVQWGNYKQTFDHVSKVFVEDAGQGDDYLDLRGVLSESEVHGGAGNDTIYLSDGSASSAYGDDGNDTITASVVENVTGVTLHGGNGNDTLTAGPTGITIYGDGGNDTITGSPRVTRFTGTTARARAPMARIRSPPVTVMTRSTAAWATTPSRAARTTIGFTVRVATTCCAAAAATTSCWAVTTTTSSTAVRATTCWWATRAMIGPTATAALTCSSARTSARSTLTRSPPSTSATSAPPSLPSRPPASPCAT
jgi:hypothetical protein